MDEPSKILTRTARQNIMTRILAGQAASVDGGWLDEHDEALRELVRDFAEAAKWFECCDRISEKHTAKCRISKLLERARLVAP